MRGGILRPAVLHGKNSKFVAGYIGLGGGAGWGEREGFIIIIITIQHAPLHSNSTCFTVKYSRYGYIYLQFMYNFFFSIDTVS
jgi:hypothetical protein